jgi:predicted RNA-binding protein with PUA-like domain
MKCELAECSFDELKNDRPNRIGKWHGVRNYQARNFIRDRMQVGDPVLFYQSNCDEPGIPGLAEIVRAGYPDPSALDPRSRYHDPKATVDDPRWYSVDIQWKKAFRTYVTLAGLKATPRLRLMKVVQRGQRLSIQPVTKRQFEIVCEMGMG